MPTGYGFNSTCSSQLPLTRPQFQEVTLGCFLQKDVHLVSQEWPCDRRQPHPRQGLIRAALPEGAMITRKVNPTGFLQDLDKRVQERPASGGQAHTGQSAGLRRDKGDLSRFGAGARELTGTVSAQFLSCVPSQKPVIYGAVRLVCFPLQHN